MMAQLIDQAQREGRRVVLFGTAPPPGGVAAPALSILRAEDARAAAAELSPRPWPVNRKAALDRLNAMALQGASIAWLSDGIDGGDAELFAEGLTTLGDLRVMLNQPVELPRLLAPGDSDARDLTVTVRRASPAGENRFTVRAVADDGRLLARAADGMAPGTTVATVSLKMPVE